ncbi:hypothetical protein ACQ4PT_057217 [Festuca glaucescens]
MAGIISGWWESIKTNLTRYVDTVQVIHGMQAGECLDEWMRAMVMCDRDSLIRTAFERKPGEVVLPFNQDGCVKATATLRRCMQRSPDVFREHIVAMDEGIKQEERRRQEAEADPRFRWWTGMKNS